MNIFNMIEICAINNNVIRNSPEYKLALQINEKLQTAWQTIGTEPRWAFWYDQANRAAQSVILNMAESWGKARGYFFSAMLISRGEATELAAALDIGPPELRNDCKPLVDDLVKQINARLLSVHKNANKQDTYFY